MSFDSVLEKIFVSSIHRYVAKTYKQDEKRQMMKDYRSEMLCENHKYAIYGLTNKNTCAFFGFMIYNKMEDFYDLCCGNCYNLVDYLIKYYKDINEISYDGKSIVINS